MKKHTKLGLLGLAAGVGAAGGLAAMGNLLYNHIMVPVPRDPAKDATNPLLQQEGRKWAKAADGFQSVVIQSVDGLRLWAAVVPAKEETHRWVICVHGFSDSHISMGVYGKHYHEAGWNVLLPDQRGYGNSEGNCVGWGFNERLDLVGWISWVVRRDPEAEILLHGVSMGGATVLMATGGALPKNVKAAVSDCAYASIEAEMRHLMAERRENGIQIPPLPSHVAFSVLRRTTLRRGGYDLRHAAPVEAVTRSKTPTLFIHGAQDNFVPANMMNKLYQAAACPKSFLWVPSADHATSVGTDPGLYWATGDTFLDTYFQQN